LNHFLCNEQFGFIPGRNTIQAVEEVVNMVLSNFESKLITSATLIDLTKAFDCISHELLLSKLSYYGVNDKELSLFDSYLGNRKQMVVQGQDVSSFRNVSVGVPQGSVLGPFLFVIAINDFTFHIPCPSILYADDTTIVNYHKDIDELILKEEESLKIAAQWFEANSLVVNNSKTERIIFSLNNLMSIENKSVNLLGIHLDSKLSWHCHVQQLCKKLSRVIFLLRKLRNYVTMNNMLITAYYAFFHSHLRYGIILWGNSSGAQKVFVWQKKALRVIKNIPLRQTCKPIFRELEIMTLPSLYIFCCLVNVKEVLGELTVRKDFHQYSTRKKHMLDLVTIRLEKTRSSHVFMKIKLFNKLPENVWYVPVQKFRVILSNWLKEKAFYSIEVIW